MSKIVALLVAASLALTPLSADARSKGMGGFSSGGNSYSKPSSPSFAPPGGAGSGYAKPAPAPNTGGYAKPDLPAPSAGSASGGYAKPGAAPPAAAPMVGQSANDRAVSGQAASDSYRKFQGQQGGGPSSVGGGNTLAGTYRRPAYDGWRQPAYAYGVPPSYGGRYQGMMWWFLLDHLANAAMMSMFFHHSGGGEYQAWRQDAEAKAHENAELKAKLADLDHRMAAMEGQPKDPTYEAPGITAEAAPSVAAKQSGTDWFTVAGVVLAGGGLVWLWRRRRA